MQFVRATSAAALFLLLGATIPAYAQRGQLDEKQGKRERQRPERRSERDPQPQQVQQQRQQPQPRQEQGGGEPQPRQQQQSQQRVQQYRQPQPQRTRQQAAVWQQQRGWARQGGWQGQSSWQQNRAQRWERDHRSWGQRGGYGGYYIPQSRFGAYFGREHWFRMRDRPIIYMGHPRFAYGGYSFLLVDPWPEYWSDDWYATDDVYIDYDDGYYLYNRRYPYVRLAITVAL